MLKVTVLTCAIIAAQPLFEGVLAGEAVPASSSSLSLVWTGRFINMTRAPTLGSVTQSAETRRSQRDGDGDPDIVGSIPPNPADDAGQNIVLLRGSQAITLCALPGLATDATTDDLACGGANHNRWSAKIETFNYDLSAVNSAFANAPTPYASPWDATPASSSQN